MASEITHDLTFLHIEDVEHAISGEKDEWF